MGALRYGILFERAGELSSWTRDEKLDTNKTGNGKRFSHSFIRKEKSEIKRVTRQQLIGDP